MLAFRQNQEALMNVFSILAVLLSFLLLRYVYVHFIRVPEDPLHPSLRTDWRILHLIRNHPKVRNAYLNNVLRRRNASEVRMVQRRYPEVRRRFLRR